MKVDVDIDACKQGEREALGNLYKAYSGKLMRICRHYVKDESTAENILHFHLYQVAERQLKIGGMDDNHCKKSRFKVSAKYREG